MNSVLLLEFAELSDWQVVAAVSALFLPALAVRYGEHVDSLKGDTLFGVGLVLALSLVAVYPEPAVMGTAVAGAVAYAVLCYGQAEHSRLRLGRGGGTHTPQDGHSDGQGETGGSLSLGSKNITFVLVGAFIVGFMLVGGTYLMHNGVVNYTVDEDALDDYDEVSADILDTDVEQQTTHMPDTGATIVNYAPVVVYSYTYDGSTYTNDDINPGGDVSKSSETEARELVNEYSVGGTTTAYVDPDDPSSSFLEHEVPLSTVIAQIFLGLVLVSIGAGNIAVLVSTYRRKGL